MADPPNAENIVVSGPRAIVEYAVRNNGRSEIKEWLESQSESVQSSFVFLFKYLASNGPLFPNKERFKKVSGMDDVWEFKRAGKLGNRIFVFHYGRRWLLTHPYKKGHSKNHQTTSARHAIAIANEHIDRELAAIQRKAKREAQ